MAEVTTITAHTDVEAYLHDLPQGTSLSARGKSYHASCYWPAEDVIRGAHCFGVAGTLEAAIADMCAQLEKAKTARAKLRTAAECKTAVLNLIREHDAAPAAFRDAVDDLDVA